MELKFETLTLKEIKEKAKGRLGYCFSCDVCDGRACKGTIPGPGAMGDGNVAIKNYEAWKKYMLEIDPITERSENEEIDTSTTLFGKKIDIPVFAGSISNIRLHYSKVYTEERYDEILINNCKNSGIIPFTGDSDDESVFEDSIKVIKKFDGYGIPTIKPWHYEEFKKKFELMKTANPIAFAIDLESMNTPFLQAGGGMAQSYTTSILQDIIKSTDIPFIVKGVMNLKVAKKVVDAGVKTIVVSNHGGRVLDEMPSTADVLPEIVEYAKGKCNILVDGGIRNGRDVFKALALGANAVLIARPMVQMIFGDEESGIITYIESLKKELKYTMNMCGARKISDICSSMIRREE